MLKKLWIIIMALLILLVSGCTAGVSQEEYDALAAELEQVKTDIKKLQTVPSPTPAPQVQPLMQEIVVSQIESTAFNVEAVIKQLKMTEHILKQDYSNQAIVVIKNESPYHIEIEVTASFYDEQDKLIGTSSDNECAFQSGYELTFVFRNKEDFSRVDYDIWVDKEDSYECVLSNLSYDVSTTDEKAIISVTNNGNNAASYVEYTVLFLNGDKVVNYDEGYCMDGDSEIKPGRMQRAEAYSSEPFDSVKVFLSGYAE